MKRILCLLFLFFLSTAFGQKEEAKSVLFIGNSFTFHNNMPVLFKEISESLGQNVLIDTVVKGGKDINYHSQQELTYTKVKERNWDYIVIQGHSNEFAKYDDVINSNTLPYLKQILDSIEMYSKESMVLMYMTWGYKRGNNAWDTVNTYNKMQDLIQRQYTKTAITYSIGLSPVGVVWREVRRQKRCLNLYARDKYHPSKYGSFLSACTFFARIFEESPKGSKVNTKLKRRKKEAIEKIVTEVVLNPKRN